MSDEYGIGRHVSNLFVTQTYEGQSDIHCKYCMAQGDINAYCDASLDFGKSDHGYSGFLLTEGCRAGGGILCIYFVHGCRHWIVLSTQNVQAQMYLRMRE